MVWVDTINAALAARVTWTNALTMALILVVGVDCGGGARDA